MKMMIDHSIIEDENRIDDSRIDRHRIIVLNRKK